MMTNRNTPPNAAAGRFTGSVPFTDEGSAASIDLAAKRSIRATNARNASLDISNQTCTLRTSMRARFKVGVSGAAFGATFGPKVSSSLGAILCVALGVSGCAKMAARDLVREGNSLYKEGRYEKALDKYNEAAELEPDGVTVFRNRAFAAESMVLRLKDATSAERLAERKKHADVALEDLQRWYDRLEIKTEADTKMFADHRLAVLSADNRCDELIAHWTEKHKSNPKDEGLYSVIARTWEDVCEKPEKADQWYEQRTKDFPNSEKAWHSLAVRTFTPLFPDDPDAGQIYNLSLTPEERREIANEVIGLLEKATAIKPKYRDPYIWRAMSYSQRSLAREYSDPPNGPVEKMAAIDARNDLMLAWKEQKAVCDIDSLPDCAKIIDPATIFAAPKKLDGQEIELRGNVDGESVKDLGGGKWELDLLVKVKEAAAPSKRKKRRRRKKAAEAVKPSYKTERVKVQFEFLPPQKDEEGEEIDRSEQIEAVTTGWKNGVYQAFNGFIDRSGSTFTVKEKASQACCPLQPISKAEVAADAATRKKLEDEIRKLEAKEERKKNRGKRGRRR